MGEGALVEVGGFPRCQWGGHPWTVWLQGGQRHGHGHRCTSVGDGNTSPTTKLYKFYHLLPTVRIFLLCLLHGRIHKVMENDKVVNNLLQYFHE